MRRVELLPKAKQDLVDAAEWYEAERKGLGQDFLRGMALVSDGLRRLPERHPVLSGSTRRAKMRRFPYMVLYVVQQDVILIVAVLHEHRHPGRWAERVQEGGVSHRFAGAAS